MEKEFVTYEIAKDLKELNFNAPCVMYYKDYGKLHDKHDLWNPGQDGDTTAIDSLELDNMLHYEYLAPLWQQAIDWLIKEHNLFIDIFKWSVKYYINDELQSPRFLFDIDTYNDYSDDWIYQSVNDDLKYETYQEAREAAIIKCIEIIKNENNKQG